MTVGLSKDCRRFAAEMALLGLMFYATLLSWHYAYRAQSFAGFESAVEFSTAFCHSGGSGNASELPDKPAPSRSDCPLCAGMAAGQPLVLPDAGIVDCQVPSGIYGHITKSTSAIADLLDGPRSRGPPRLLVI